MLRSEFFERTNVVVSNEEFEQIHADYMSTDIDKDTFCAEWCKKNKARVREQKTLRKIVEHKMKQADIAFNAFQKLYKFEHMEMPCCVVLSVSEIIAIENCGVSTTIFNGETKMKSVMEVYLDLHEKFGWMPLS